MMASTMATLPFNIGASKGFECPNYAGLRPSVNWNFVCFRPVNGGASSGRRRLFVVRASETRDGQMEKIGLSVEECEAAVVAGNAPLAPPAAPKPAAPAGTPVVPSLVSILEKTLLQLTFAFRELIFMVDVMNSNV